MKPLVVYLVVCVGYAACYSDIARSIDDQWESYKSTYNKKYDGSEELSRKAAFARSLQKIEEHNKSGKSWQIALNDFSDMTTEERASAFGAQQTPERQLSEFSTATADSSTRQLPASFDWRTHKCMPPAKNRGSCKMGDWAFAAVAVLEFSQCNKTGYLVEFSEQQVLDCTEGTSGCTKGCEKAGLSYLRAYGALTSSSYPFVSGSSGRIGACNYCSVLGDGKVAAKPLSRNSVSGEAAIMDMIVKRGLTTTAGSFPAGDIESLIDYKSGVYDPSPGALLGATAKFSFNLVGWGTDAGTGKKYWIARNSLGEDWGQDGFFLLIRGKNKDFEKTSVSYIHKI